MTTDKLKKVEIMDFRKQLSQNEWIVIMVNEKSDNICNACDNVCNYYNNNVSSVCFANGRSKFREICCNCLKIINHHLFDSIIDYADHMRDILNTENLSQRPQNKVHRLITTELMHYCGACDDDIIDLACCACDQYQILMRRRPNILLEDLANININLMKSFSLGKPLFARDNIYGYKTCLCGRYYHPVFETRKQCLECYANFDIHDAYSELRKNIHSTIMNDYSIETIEELSNYFCNYQEYECYICNNNDVKYIYKFDCGHSICHECQFSIKIRSHDHFSTINCPFCRYPQRLVKDNMITWSKNYIQIKHELEQFMASGKCQSLTMPEKCKYRSNYIIQQMMKKRDLKVCKYLEKLEAMKLLGWCDYFPDGLLINQDFPTNHTK